MITSKNRNIRLPVLIMLSAFFAAHLCFWLLPNVFGIWNSQTVDQLFILRSLTKKLRPAYNSTVVHVDFNNSSIEQLNNLYLNRLHFARLVRNLKYMQVAAQVYDLIFAAKIDAQDDLVFIQAVKDAGNTYFGLALELKEPGEPINRIRAASDSIGNSYLLQAKWSVSVDTACDKLYEGGNPLITYAELANASRGQGSLSVKFDQDGVLRRVPLLVRYDDAFYPLLPLLVVCDYLQVPPEKIILKPGRSIILKDAKRPGSEPHDIKIPIDHRGNMIVNYIGPWGSMAHYNFADIIRASDDRDEMEIWAEELKGKIVVVSDVSTGSSDIGPVPTDTNFPLSGVHANVIHNILNESFLKAFSDWEMLVIEAVLLAVLLFLSLRFSSLAFSFGTISLMAAFIGAAIVSFLYGQIILNIVRPLLMISFATVALLIYRYINEEKQKMESLRQRDMIRDTFGRYLSKEVVEELLDSPTGLEMSGENREVTFLVSDLRGFTALTSNMPPRQVIEIINRYFEKMVDVIARYQGTVNEFMGDGILVFFGAPFNADNDPERAVACAIEMQNALTAVNAEQQRLKLPELSMGIGINTGEVVVGNIGSKQRASYGAVGTPIYTAYRIESFTVGGQVLISTTTHDRIEANLAIQGTKDVKFKGLNETLTLYDVIGIGGPYQVFLPKKKATPFTRLDSPLPFECFIIKDKAVSDRAIAGRITHLGENSAKVVLNEKLLAYTDLRIVLTVPAKSGHSELYAKTVLQEKPNDSALHHHALLQFTSIPQEIKNFFNNRLSYG